MTVALVQRRTRCVGGLARSRGIPPPAPMLRESAPLSRARIRPETSAQHARSPAAKLRLPGALRLPSRNSRWRSPSSAKSRRSPWEGKIPRNVDSPLEGTGFEPVWGFSCQAVFLVCCRFFVRSEKAVPRPVACDQVRGACGRGQGTETVAELGGLPPSRACVSQRLDA